MAISHFHCRQSTSDAAMQAIKLYECFSWCYSTPHASLRGTCVFPLLWPCLVLFCSQNSSTCPPPFYYRMCGCGFYQGQRTQEKSSILFCGMPLNPQFTPSFLCHLLFLSFSLSLSPHPPRGWIPQPHHNAVNRRSPDRFTAIVFPLAASVTAEI